MNIRVVVLIAILIGVVIGAMLVMASGAMEARCTAVEQALGECE